MSSYLRLKHLTFAGAGGRTATLDISEGLTVVYGASDTGKSFICSAIDYMFRGKLKPIPETGQYSNVLLGIDQGDTQPITLVRTLDGGDVFAYRRETRSVPAEPPEHVLTTTPYRRKGHDSLSDFLLRLIDMDEKTIRRKVDGTSRALGVRDIAHLCIIDETKMQSPVRPAMSGQYVTRTAEQSVMRFLLTGQDDGQMRDVITDIERRMTNAQRELLTSIIGELRVGLATSPDPVDLAAQEERLSVSITQSTQGLTLLVEARDVALADRDGASAMRSSVETRLAELVEMSARFRLLAAQYESDLRRLALLSETGDLLGLFQSDVCVFCGSDLSGHDGSHGSAQPTRPAEFAQAVEAESARVKSLLGDLRGTLREVNDEAENSIAMLGDLDGRIAEFNAEFVRLEQALRPGQADLEALIEAREEVRKLLGQWDHVARLEERLPEQVPERPREDAPVADASALEASRRELAAKIKSILKAWDFVGAEDVRVDDAFFEPIVDDRARSERGKGVRAMQHAAFTVALAEYCIERDLPHPGFVVLDSPLVTYREPEAEDVEATPAVPDAFYRYLANDFPGQAIVLENTPPPALGHSSSVVHLTGIEGSGRFGFL